MALARLVKRFSIVHWPMDTVFSSSAIELVPIAVAPCAVALAPEPKALLHFALALEACPIAVLYSPLAWFM